MLRRLAFAVFCAWSVAYAVADDSAAIDAPDFAIGDRWVFRISDLFNGQELARWDNVVSGQHEDAVRFSGTTLASKDASRIGRTFKDTATRDTLTFHNGSIVEGTVVNFDFPLTAGKTWSYTYKLKRKDGSGFTDFTCDAKANGLEDVQVMAGTFKAMKVTHFCPFRVTSGSSGKVTTTYWYAPAVKREVKKEFIDVGGERLLTELAEYTLK